MTSRDEAHYRQRIAVWLDNVVEDLDAAIALAYHLPDANEAAVFRANAEAIVGQVIGLLVLPTAAKGMNTQTERQDCDVYQ